MSFQRAYSIADHAVNHDNASNNIAVIDTGSITMLMTVAITAENTAAPTAPNRFIPVFTGTEESPGAPPISKKRKILKIIDNQIQYPKLGEGVHQNRNFLDAAMTRSREVFQQYAAICKNLNVDKIIAVATSASRDAKNAAQFYEEIKKETGINVQIISGETESRLSFMGGLLDHQDPSTHALMDIGGGSTEFVCLNDTDINGQSLDIGSIRATEMFLKSDPYTKSSLEELEKGLKKFYKTLNQSLQEKLKIKSWVAIAGTPTVLAAMKHGISSFTSEKIDGTTLGKKEVFDLYKSLAGMTRSERQAIPLIGPQRADVIVAGAAILTTAMEYFNNNEITVSTRGLRHGILVSDFA